MDVKDIMNTNVQTAGGDTTVQEAADQMSEHRVGCLLVTTDHKLLGILTERDILKKVVAENKDCSKTKIKTIMTKKVILIKPDMNLGEAVDLMITKKIKKLPVLEGKKLIGIVTATDIATAEPKMLEELGKLLMVPGKKQLMAG